MAKRSATKQTDTREKLLQTAISLIWQSSYHRVGVNEMCTQAGVTKGSFYHYFESKAALFEAASDYYWQGFKLELDAIFSPNNDALTQLELLLHYAIDKQIQHADGSNPVSGCPFFTAGAQVGAGEDAVRNAALEMTRKCERYNTALTRNLQAGGYLNQDRDAEQTGRLIGQYIQGLLLYGRVCADLNAVKRDIRIGMYSLLGLKEAYWQDWEKEPTAQSMSPAPQTA